MSDIDLLVDSAVASSAQAVLAGLGYDARQSRTVEPWSDIIICRPPRKSPMGM